MPKVTIEMPNVSACSVQECAYNTNNACHARAITVGDGMHAMCDTFFKSAAHSAEKSRIAGVGACKVNNCVYNDDLECQAESINVGHRQGSVECLTFSAE